MKFCYGTKACVQPYRLEDVNVYVRGSELVITTPQLKMSQYYETQQDSYPKHDCKYMGCKQGYHVIIRTEINQYQSDVIDNLCRFLDESCELQIEGVMRYGNIVEGK